MKKFSFTIDGHKYEVAVNDFEDNIAEIEVNGTPFVVEVDVEKKTVAAPKPAQRPATVAAAPSASAAASAAASVKVTAQLSGTIMKILVKEGDAVKKGDTILTMESMKMENNIVAETDGVISKIVVVSGQNVMQNDTLVEMTSSAAPAAAPVQPVAAPAPAPKPAAPAPAAPAAGGHKVKSPLPGSVLKVMVTQGQAVKKGDTLLTLESMKMENAIQADVDGTVSQIAVAAGQSVMQDDLLVVLS